jgi:hypothetical protein
MKATSVPTIKAGEALAVAHRSGSADPDTHASKGDLRNFGLMLGALFGAIFGLLVPLLHRRQVPWWPWTVTGFFVLAAVIRPALLLHFRVAWNELGKVLGAINSWLILAVLFYAVVTPIGLALQLLSYFSSQRHTTGAQKSYRTESPQITREIFERPF